jgi:hypothetical protein
MEANLEAFRKATGITPTTGFGDEALRGISYKAFALIKALGDDSEISDLAFEMIKVIERERSGIRDGDGYWHGSDVMGHFMHDMIEACEKHPEAKLASEMGGLCNRYLFCTAPDGAAPSGTLPF